jgi:hypothetical protein
VTVHVTVSGWAVGFEKIRFTHLLMDSTGMNFADAKHSTDGLVGGAPIELEFDSELAASNFRASAARLGAIMAEDS